MKKKFLALILTGVLAMSATACGDSSKDANTSVNTVNTDSRTETQDDAALPTEQAATEAQPDVDPLEEAMKNMEAVTSMEAQMIMDMDMTISADGQEQSIETSTIMDMVYFNDPLKIKMDMTIDMGDQGSMNMQVYAEPSESGTYNMYMFDGQSWSTSESAASGLTDYDARSNMMGYIGDASQYTQEGTEQVNGANAYKYSYVLTEEEMKEQMMDSGALDSVSSLGLDVSQVDSMLDNLGEVTTYVWIDAESLYPVKYEMDMTTVMDNLMTNMVEAMGEQAEGVSMHFPEMKVVMTCSNFNNATDFTVPDEAKN
ncbi:MAG: hypothetical protein K2K74_17755 [Lachnospiraceae bacterium]|nr:hypothetical protein [Lachnospiraceae bacterium]